MSKILLQIIAKYEEGIRKHRDAKGHDRCWENDIELYDLLPERCNEWPAKDTIPCKEEFQKGCQIYYQSLLKKE